MGLLSRQQEEKLMAKKRKNSRRANGEGSIVQRKDGRWCGVVTLGYKPDDKINKQILFKRF